MARPRAPKAAAPRPLQPAGDRTLYTHNLWLNYLKPVSIGLVASPNALRLAQVDLPLQDGAAQNALLALTAARPAANGEDPGDDDPRGVGRLLPDPRAVLVDFLG